MSDIPNILPQLELPQDFTSSLTASTPTKGTTVIVITSNTGTSTSNTPSTGVFVMKFQDMPKLPNFVPTKCYQ